MNARTKFLSCLFVFFAFYSVGAAVAATPIAQLNFDETSGTTAFDSSGNGINGALINGPAWTQGKLGNALSFDGVDDQVKVDGATLRNLTTMTLSVWVNPKSGGGAGTGEARILSKGGLPTGNRRFLIQIGPGNSSIAFVASYTTSQGGWVTRPGSLSLNSWHHVVVTYTYGDVNNLPNIYIDGALQPISTLVAPVGSPISDDSILYVGSRGVDNLKVFDGLIDQVGIYDRVLNSSEVIALYNAENPSLTSSLTVSGNKILANGNTIQIKGVQIVALVIPAPTLQIKTQFWYFKDAYDNVIVKSDGLDKMIAAAKSWGANTIRFQLSQPGLDPLHPSLTPVQHAEYVSQVLQAITRATNAGLFAIASMQDEWDDAINQMPSEETWRALQTFLPLFKDNQSVIYDLFNEPRISEIDQTSSTPQDWNIWKNGGTLIDSQGTTYQTVGMQTLVNRLRQAGSNNALLVEVLNYGFENITTDPTHLVSDPLGKIIYSFHYGWAGGLTTGANFSLTTNKIAFDALIGNAAKTIPLVNGEWNMAQYVGGTPWKTPICEDIPQIAHFEVAYFQKYTAGVVGFSFDLPPYTITKDWNYAPSTYSDGSLCSILPPPDVTHPLGDGGSLLYSWYHDGTDLWSLLGGDSLPPAPPANFRLGS